MSLHIEKLEELLGVNGYIPIKYFIIDGTCAYILVMSIKGIDTFLLYIPSKYKFKMKSGHGKYKLKYIDVSDTSNFANLPDETKTEISYTLPDGEEIGNSMNGVDLEKHLEENYNHPIVLNEVTLKDHKEVNKLYRQLHRLRYSVKDISYKLSVFYKDYICTIRRDDSIDCFHISNYYGSEITQLSITVDLETLYENLPNLQKDLIAVRAGLFNVLNRNQVLNTRTLSKLIEDRKDIQAHSEKCRNVSESYTTDIDRFNEMLHRLVTREKSIIKSIYEINNSASTGGGIYKDIEKVHVKTTLEGQLEEINGHKKTIIETLLELKEKKENIILTLDRLLFDTSMMFDAISDSFNELLILCENK